MWFLMGRCALSQHYRSTIEYWHQNERVTLAGRWVQGNATAHAWCLLVDVSLSDTAGVTIVCKISSQCGVTDLCINEQMAE